MTVPSLLAVWRVVRAIPLAVVSLSGACRLFGSDAVSAPALSRKWFAPIAIAGDFSTFGGLPVVAEGVVVVPVPGGVLAIDTSSGSRRWRTILVPSMLTPKTTLAVHDSTVCMVDPVVVGCVSLRDGRVLWKVEGDSVGSGTTAAADATTLYYGRDHTVVARSLADGGIRWAVDIAPDAPFHAGPAGMTARGDTLFVSAVRKLDAARHELRGDLVALDGPTGKIHWTFTANPLPGSLRAELWAPPVLVGSLALVGELDGAWLIAVDTRGGREVWRTHADSLGYVQTETGPSVRGDTVFVGSSDTHFYALDLANGQLRWRTRVPFSIRASSVCGRVAIVTPYGGGELWTVGLDSRVAAKASMTDPGDDAESQIAVVGQTGYVMSMRGLYAFRCAA